MFKKFSQSKSASEYFILKQRISELLIKSFSFLNMFSLKSRIMTSFLILSIVPLIIVTISSYIKTRSTIEKLSVSNSVQIVTQIAENINIATKYYDNQMSQFIVDPKVQDALWKVINLKDTNTQKRQSLDYINLSILDFLSTRNADISALGICTSGGLSFGKFPEGISSKDFFNAEGKGKNIIKKIVSANGSPIWISPQECLEDFNKRITSIIICRSINNIDNANTIILAMELNTYNLNDLCTPNNIGEGVNNFSFIIDDKDNIVSYNDPDKIGKNVRTMFKSKDAIDKIDSVGSGLMRFNTTFNNMDCYISVTRINMNKRWKLINIIDNSYLYCEAYKNVHFTIFVWSICVVIALIISLAISLNVSSAVLTVAKGLSDIAEGGEVHLDKKLKITSNDEIKDLVIAFNKIQDMEKENIKSIKKNQNELITTLNTLKNTQAQLVQSEKMASLGSLVAGVAHEINTPIGISVTACSHLISKSQTFTKLIQNKTLKRSDLNEFSSTLTETSEILFRNLERASELIKSFKQVSVDQTYEEKRVFNVKQYLNEIVVSLTPSLKKRKINVEVNCTEDIEIKTYAGSISQIITNLVMNSLMHAFGLDDYGVIVIDAYTSDDNMLVINFKDDGRGMEKDVLGKIFDPFFTTKRGHGGTGLGLNLVYNIVYQKLGGTISCTSEPGKGTNFKIEFPITRD